MFQVPGSMFRVRVPVHVRSATFVLLSSANCGADFGTANLEPGTSNSNLNTNMEPGTWNLARHVS